MQVQGLSTPCKTVDVPKRCTQTVALIKLLKHGPLQVQRQSHLLSSGHILPAC